MPPNDQITCSTTVLAPSNSNSRFRSTHRSEHIQDRCKSFHTRSSSPVKRLSTYEGAPYCASHEQHGPRRSRLTQVKEKRGVSIVQENEGNTNKERSIPLIFRHYRPTVKETLEEKDDNEKVPEPQVARSSGQRSNRNGYLSLILNPPEPETTTNSVELRANSPTVTRRNNPIQRDVETVPAAMPLEQTSGPHPQISNVELQELSPFQPFDYVPSDHRYRFSTKDELKSYGISGTNGQLATEAQLGLATEAQFGLEF